MENVKENSPPPYLLSLIEDSIGKKTIHWTVPDCGLSAALRFSVTFEDDSKVFVKASTDELTEYWLRNEHLALSTIGGLCAPKIIDWIDKPGIRPVLISQDLSDAYWPASHHGVVWRDGDPALLIDAVQKLSSQDAPATLLAMTNWKTPYWPLIAANPDTFIASGFCSASWFNQSKDALILAESKSDLTGNALVHGDIRSDNICIAGSQIIFVDWSHAARGNKNHDLATLLPTLHLEGGPAPYEIMPDGGSEAASAAAGLFERLQADQAMPQWLSNVFMKLIAIDLEWTAQCLGLEAPDGIHWQTR